jgi:predicted ATPase
MCRLLLAAGPGIRVLASSREPLRVAGESAYPIPALDGPQAIELFVDRARAASPSFAPGPSQAATMEEICRRLDGIPLAIELAAARVRALPVEKISERLDDCFRLLTDGDPTALPRQKTMRASIDWSHDLLPAPERILLRRLAVFAGSFTLEAAEAVCAGGEVERSESVLELLTHLVEKSLVAKDAGGQRYRLLETMRQYARERLEESGELHSTRDRHLAYYLDLAQRAGEGIVGPDQASWLTALDAERQNLLTAHAWCDRAPEGQEHGLLLVTSIRQYWLSRGLLTLAFGVMVQALDRAPARSALRTQALFTAGQLACYMGIHGEARRYLEEALSIARELGDDQRIASVLQPLGVACLGQGDLGAARVHFTDAVARARAQQDPRKIAAALNCLAALHRLEGDLDAAEPLYQHTLELARGLQDRESVAIALLNLAMTATERRNAMRSGSLLQEAAGIAAELASSALAQNVLEACAGLAALEAQRERAARFFGAAEAQAARSALRRDSCDEAFLSSWMARAREGGDPARLAAAESAGRAQALPDALAEAIAWLDRS